MLLGTQQARPDISVRPPFRICYYDLKFAIADPFMQKIDPESFKHLSYYIPTYRTCRVPKIKCYMRPAFHFRKTIMSSHFMKGILN